MEAWQPVFDDDDADHAVADADAAEHGHPERLIIERHLTLSRPAQLAVALILTLIATTTYVAGRAGTNASPAPPVPATTSTIRAPRRTAATVPVTPPRPGLVLDAATRRTHRAPSGEAVESIAASCSSPPDAACDATQRTVRLAYAYGLGADTRGVAWITYAPASSALVRSISWAPDREPSAPVELTVIEAEDPVARVRVYGTTAPGDLVVDEQDAVDGVAAFANGPDVHHTMVEGIDASGTVIVTCDARPGQACGARRNGPARRGPAPVDR